VSVAPHAAFHLDAETSSGEVKSELPIRVRGPFDSDELHGKVGEGPSEAEVKLSTSSGDIHLSGMSLKRRPRRAGPDRTGLLVIPVGSWAGRQEDVYR
jgi:hypothetical protein